MRGFSKTWTPYDLGPGSLAAWWSADDFGTARMTDDGAGVISSWVDRITGLAVTATTTARPTCLAAGMAGKPAMAFAGALTCLVTTTLTALPTGAEAGEIWGTLADEAGNGDALGRCAMRYGGNANDAFRSLDRTRTGGVARPRVGVSATEGASTLIGATSDFNGAHVVRGQFSGTTLAGQIDGADMSPASASGAPTLATGTTRMRFGAGTSGSAAEFWLGKIRHIIVTRGLLPAREATLLGRYLLADIA